MQTIPEIDLKFLIRLGYERLPNVPDIYCRECKSRRYKPLMVNIKSKGARRNFFRFLGAI